jgi:hypothetical protein
VTVSVTPDTTTISVGDSRTFGASVTGAADPSVVWSVQEGPTGGTVAADGTYTAPPVPGVFHVVATSAADSSRTATATVTVQAGGASGTIQ